MIFQRGDWILLGCILYYIFCIFMIGMVAMEAERAGAPFATGAILTLIPMWLIGMKLTHE